MKRVSIFTIALLICTMTYAQEALWGGSAVVSPEIHADNTVTFRLLAPHAEKVQVTGDFLPVQQIVTPDGKTEGVRVADLVKNDKGVWEYTTPEPLPSELYYYTFLVDELEITDPSNVYMIRDVTSVTSVFIIGGGCGDLYKVNKVPHGTVARLWYNSPTLNLDRRLTVYTPAGYEGGNDRYPVFYLLHGAGGDEEAWISLGRSSQILDNLIAQGKAKPMIVVMTNGNPTQEAAPGESSLGYTVPTMRQPRGVEGSFEMAFPDVVNFIDANYRTIADKQHRAIAGLSMGGGHSLHISMQYPDMFDYVGLFSAGIRFNRETQSPVYEDIEGKLEIQFSKEPALYWIAIGKEDFLYDANAEYRKMLDEKGYKYTYYESGEGHIWRNWRIYLSMFAPMLFN